MLPPLIAIVGPTAVGKTEVSIAVAEALNGEVISADSRQVYRGMDIGTAKGTPEQRSAVPHHLLDVVEPDQVLTLADYQQLARQAMDSIVQSERVPFLVGGSGLYVRAVLEGWTIPRVPPDLLLRESLEREANLRGPDFLHSWLRQMDSKAAERIDARNVRRVIRALEVSLRTGQPITSLQSKRPPPYRVLRVGLTIDRDVLYHRIDQRVDHMLEAGLVDEVRCLMAKGYAFDLPAMSGLGYRQIGQYLLGEMTLEDATVVIKRDTRRFVRRQYAWFRLQDERFHWFDRSSPDCVSRIEHLARQHIAEAAELPPS